MGLARSEGLSLEKLERLRAFDEYPKNAATDNPAESHRGKFLESLGFLVTVQLLFSEAALLKKADELGVLHTKIL